MLGLDQTVALPARSSLTCAEQPPSALQNYGTTVAFFVRPCKDCLRTDVPDGVHNRCKGNSSFPYSAPYWRPLGSGSAWVQNLLKVEWRRRIPTDAILQTVLIDFCDRFCLPTCQMLHNDRLLQPEQRLVQVQAVRWLSLQHHSREMSFAPLMLRKPAHPSIVYCSWSTMQQTCYNWKQSLCLLLHTVCGTTFGR